MAVNNIISILGFGGRIERALCVLPRLENKCTIKEMLGNGDSTYANTVTLKIVF
jgi:hypothetical protein